ncbi:class I SAM-dependent methyltransferase [Janthinobacterium sp. GW458P]|uniref:class I SAM-dependent methyltransferase n=1 Tax=Janthinobacterium sp. GW458P TaxID=1981504 RepID=UPI000A31E585|nr:class I SAM-dependent methyltransferase [Janthinobacterium sp. GW458P]MBE3025680.1 class I SAM-dependent methyltransferase [Janthinobacterium sp. GW458P]
MSDAIPAPPPAPGAPDYAAIKQRQQAGWASGDFAVIGVTLQIVGESLAEAADIRAHEDVIDIAAGNGNATLAAARRFARVVSTDYVPALLEKGRARAEAEGLAVTFRVADAENLPFDGASFDAALSTFGVMFAPDHRRAASEMLRMLRPGGRIGMANWTPDGFIGQLFRIIGKYVPPPAGVTSPARWGEEAYLRDLFGRGAEQVHAQRKFFNFRYASAAHWLQVFRDYYGPVHKAYAALDQAGARALEQDLTTLLERSNTAGAQSLVVPAEYLEVIINKRRS